MNNKRIGTEFEREFCRLLASEGWWVHFITPAATGAQPFDVIAVRDGCAMAYDCKTSAKKAFSLTRLEENQKMAFEKWIRCGNAEPQIAVKYQDHIYLIGYITLKERGSVNIDEMQIFA